MTMTSFLLCRAEKTEVLSEDLQNAERRVEVLKSVLQNLVKKLTASLHAHGIQDRDKRAVRACVHFVVSSVLI